MNTNEDESSERVRKVVARFFKVSPEVVTPEVALAQLPGWDSLGHLSLMMEIEKEFSLRFPTDKINQPKTPAELCALVRETSAR